MRTRWTGLTLTVAGLAACGAGTSQTPTGYPVTTTGTFSQSIMCMEAALRDRDYRIVSLDKRDGLLQAQQADEELKLKNPRVYGAGNQIDVKPGPKPKDGTARTLVVTPSGYTLTWLPNGSSTSLIAPTDSAVAVAKYLADNCSQ